MNDGEKWRDLLPGLGLAAGAGVGLTIGLLLTGGWGLSLGVACGAAAGLTIGAAARSLRRVPPRTR